MIEEQVQEAFKAESISFDIITNLPALREAVADFSSFWSAIVRHRSASTEMLFINFNITEKTEQMKEYRNIYTITTDTGRVLVNKH